MKPNIIVENGIIHTSGYEQCSIINNGNTYNISGGTLIGGLYGLIEYNCDKYRGFIVSKMSCKNCGLYCKENQMMEGCEQVLLPTMIGILLGIIVFATLLFLTIKLLYPYIATKVNGLLSDCRKKRLRRTLKQDNKLRARLGIVRYPSLTEVAVILMIIATVLGCDNSLYIGSEGVICDNDKCVRSEMFDISIETGSTLCFRTGLGDLTTITLSKTFRAIRSMMLYKTSSYSITVSQKWHCKGTDICWQGGCHSESMHPSLKIPKSNVSAIGYGCDMDTLGCDTYCHHRVACTYYRWEVKPYGQQYPIYKIVTKYWGIKILMTHGNISRTISMNVNNPKFDLETVDQHKYPVFVTGFNAQEDDIEKYYIKIDDKFYNIDASGINMPDQHKIGDIQIGLDNKSMTIDTHNIKCSTHSCTAKCKINEPKLNRMINNINDYMDHDGVYVGSDDTLLTFQPVHGIARLMIGNIGIKSLRVKSAKCKLDLIGTFSCSGCNIQAYLIIQASEITEPGTVEFSSNCTFSQSYASCNEEPFKLEIVGGSKYCKLYFKSLNTSIIAHLNYNFLGKLDPSSSISGSGVEIENIYNLSSNPQLWNVLNMTWISLSIFSIIISIIMKNYQSILKLMITCMVCKATRESTNDK